MVRLAPPPAVTAITDRKACVFQFLAQTPNTLKSQLSLAKTCTADSHLLQDRDAFVGDGSNDGAERETAWLQRGHHAGALPGAGDGAPGHEVGVEELHHDVGAERPPAEGLRVRVARVVEVHEDELALPPRGPQRVGEAAPVEERVVAAVLLLEHAEEQELLGDERRQRKLLLLRWPQVMGKCRGVAAAPPRGAAARDGPRQPLHDARRQPRQGPGEVVARVPEALARASAAPSRRT